MFEQLISNRSLKQTLAAMIGGKRLSHAFLIQGEAGSGKKLLAGLLAQAAVCTGTGTGTEIPCGHCSACQKAERGIHPDILSYGMDCEKPQSFHIEEIREIRSSAYILPNDGMKKVYLLYNAQNMTLAAQNALLKILEEPPAPAMFLLVCENKSSLLETIVSRCTLLTMQIPTVEECAHFLEEKFPEREQQELLSTASAAEGNIGRSLALLEAEGEGAFLQMAEELLMDFLLQDEFSFASRLAGFERKKEDFRRLLPLVKTLWKDAVLEKYTATTRNSAVKQAAGRLSALQCMKILAIIEDAERYLDQNVNFSLLLTWFCASCKEIV